MNASDLAARRAAATSASGAPLPASKISAHACPRCGAAKEGGTVVCWPCYNGPLHGLDAEGWSEWSARGCKYPLGDHPDLILTSSGDPAEPIVASPAAPAASRAVELRARAVDESSARLDPKRISDYACPRCGEAKQTEKVVCWPCYKTLTHASFAQGDRWYAWCGLSAKYKLGEHPGIPPMHCYVCKVASPTRPCEHMLLDAGPTSPLHFQRADEPEPAKPAPRKFDPDDLSMFDLEE